VSKLANISFLLLCSWARILLGYFFQLSLLAISQTICTVVTCEGGNLYLSYYPLPSQNPRSPGKSPLGLATLNRKNHPIEVTLGRIGSSYTNFSFQSLTFYPYYKLCDNISAPLPGNTESNLPQGDNFSISLSSRIFILQAYLATPH
jgi:hypothetical protein